MNVLDNVKEVETKILEVYDEMIPMTKHPEKIKAYKLRGISEKLRALAERVDEIEEEIEPCKLEKYLLKMGGTCV